MRKARRKVVPAERFVRIWQTSRTRGEAARRLGVTSNAAGVRAHLLRTHKKHPVNLKMFRDRIDYARLVRIARESLS